VTDMSGAWHHAFAALRRRDVLRWLALLEAADLLLDVFHGYLALYFVDVAETSAGVAALAVAVWTGAGLVGDWALLWVLRHMSGRRYLRASAIAALAVYPAFLLLPGYGAKLALAAVLGLLNSGWYAIPKAGLYESLPGRSGTAVAVGGVAGIAGAAVPLALGLLAGAAGLAPTMWALLLAPVALLVLVPKR
jgi:MFS transporter, FSR family, fosmidomycin resistance protein